MHLMLLRPVDVLTTVSSLTGRAWMACHGFIPQIGISRLHVILTLLLIEFTFLLRCCILVLLVLGDKIVHVALGLRELHLIHTLARVPVKECLPTEHRREILSNTLEHLLDGRRVPQEGHCPC